MRSRFIKTHYALAALLLASSVISVPALSHEHKKSVDHHAQEQAEGVQVTVQAVSERIHLLQGKGGNVALFEGADGALLIDNDYRKVTPQILKAVKEITDKDIRFVFNTHWHGDHTGGNKMLGEQGNLIVAHDNVRTRLENDQYIEAFDMEHEAAPKVALPVITYNDEATFHMNGESVRVFHVPSAHTDGDSVLHFPKANVIHTGDVFFNGFYPFIDSATGGRLKGMIKAVDQVLALADEDTKIIPGHGPLANKEDLQAYRDMLAGVYDVLGPMKNAGKTLDEVREKKPLEPFNDEWGDGFLLPEKWLEIVYSAIDKEVKAQ